ncbi:MAG: DUF2812 domain-containing protein [Oscillospiraceae bacterium]|jgi:hypothetical protein|nr:DUF2812 domain-containing protein [Oscillospiraceae bacterium]
MGKKHMRFFGGLITAQEKWLNKMSSEGWRLTRTAKLIYEFEPCSPGQYQYCIDFIGHKSQKGGKDYRAFLEEMGYKVFYKNINLNWSVGKVVWRPWAEGGGRVATNPGAYNKELLIVEKENDGKPFELHTSYEDKIRYVKAVRNPWLFLFLLFAVLATVNRVVVLGAIGVLALIPACIYQAQIKKLKREANIRE